MRRKSLLGQWLKRNPAVGVAIGVAWLLFAAAMSLRTIGWKETQGRVMEYAESEERYTVERGHRTRTRTRTRYDVDYEYDAGAERFRGSNVYPFLNGEYRFISRMADYKPGQVVRVIYNPADPSQAVLTRGLNPDHGLALLWIVSFMFVGLRQRAQQGSGTGSTSAADAGDSGDSSEAGDASGAIARAKARAAEARARKAAGPPKP